MGELVMGDRILVVDDDRELAELLGMLLGKRGYETRVAFNATDALNIACDFEPSLILQDYVLPDMRGDELLVRLRERCPDSYVVTMTAKGSEEVAAELFRAGASDYLKKPIESDKLITTVENVLKLKSSENMRDELTGALMRHSREFLLINTLSTALNANIPRAEKYDIAADIVMKGMRADYVAISVPNRNKGGLDRLVSASSDRAGGNVSVLDAEPGLLEYVAGTNKPAAVTDFASEDRFNVSDSFKSAGITSALAVPMTLSGETVGMLGAYFMGRRNFPSFVIKLLTSFANLIALDMENEALIKKSAVMGRVIEGVTSAVSGRITVQDKEHTILFANRAAAESIGKEIKDLIGQQCCWLFHSSKGPIKGCPVEEAIGSGKRVEKTLDLGGETGSLLVTAEPILDDEGNVEMVVERVRPAR